MARRPPRDWHPEDIKAAVRKAGATLRQLADANGIDRGCMSKSLHQPHLRGEQVIAEHLGVPPWVIWPSRYSADGQPIDRRGGGRSRPRGPRPEHHRQNQEAA